MKYSLQKIFELIDAEKTETDYYYDISRGGDGVDYYLDLITGYSPEENVIISADCHEKRINNANIRFEEVDVDGILLYEYVGHCEDFKITRLESLNEAVNIMLGECGLLDMFTIDIIVIENGKKKSYCVRDMDGNIVHWEDIDRIKKQRSKIFVEWY